MALNNCVNFIKCDNGIMILGTMILALKSPYLFSEVFRGEKSMISRICL